VPREFRGLLLASPSKIPAVVVTVRGCASYGTSEREAEPTMDRQLPARDPLDAGAPICQVAVTGHGLPVRDLLDWTGYPIGR